MFTEENEVSEEALNHQTGPSPIAQIFNVSVSPEIFASRANLFVLVVVLVIVIETLCWLRLGRAAVYRRIAFGHT